MEYWKVFDDSFGGHSIETFESTSFVLFFALNGWKATITLKFNQPVMPDTFLDSWERNFVEFLVHELHVHLRKEDFSLQTSAQFSLTVQIPKFGDFSKFKEKFPLSHTSIPSIQEENQITNFQFISNCSKTLKIRFKFNY